MLKKDLTLYERDEHGELIPQEVELIVDEDDLSKYPELRNQTIKIIPMTRGELRKVFGSTGKAGEVAPDTSKDDDGELIVKNCKEPLYTKEEVTFLKPVYTRSIVKTIFKESGLVVDKNTGKKSMIEEDSFGKNLNESSVNVKKGV